MKVSVSLPDEDVEFLDSFAQTEGLRTRSAVLHKAVRLLREAGLDAEYEEAFLEWEESGLQDDWDVTAADSTGSDDAPR